MSNPRLGRRHRNDKNEHFGRGLEWTSGTGRCAAAALARKEMEYSLMEYWLVEAEEWKQLKETLEPFLGRITNCSSDLARSNNA